MSHRNSNSNPHGSRSHQSRAQAQGQQQWRNRDRSPTSETSSWNQGNDYRATPSSDYSNNDRNYERDRQSFNLDPSSNERDRSNFGPTEYDDGRISTDSNYNYGAAQNYRTRSDSRGYAGGPNFSSDLSNTDYGSSEYREGAHTGKGPKNYKRSDDRIHEDVSDQLTQAPYVDASEIEVSVRDGVVRLTGTVPERQMKRLAEDAAERVSGVTDIFNEIKTIAPGKTSEGNETKNAQTSGKNKSGSSSTSNMM